MEAAGQVGPGTPQMDGGGEGGAGLRWAVAMSEGLAGVMGVRDQVWRRPRSEGWKGVCGRDV